MKPIYILALLLASHLNAHAAASAKGPDFGGYNCEAVMKSAAKDLRGFCEGEPYSKRRLVDYGYQLDILENACENKEGAVSLAKALNAKVHQQDERACLEIADTLVRDSAAKR
ncbi:MAG: hypothetical protein EOP11_18165 [Proteobacteria bacterium]|nr:MAG: hypothetical protein EOP11_18165 [Pseudomonadota bacterium]